jgi:hypothetical protein
VLRDVNRKHSQALQGIESIPNHASRTLLQLLGGGQILLSKALYINLNRRCRFTNNSTLLDRRKDNVQVPLPRGSSDCPDFLNSVLFKCSLLFDLDLVFKQHAFFSVLCRHSTTFFICILSNPFHKAFLRTFMAYIYIANNCCRSRAAY